MGRSGPRDGGGLTVCSSSASLPMTFCGAHLMKQENDRWLLTLVAGSGQYPPTDPDGAAKFVNELRSPFNRADAPAVRAYLEVF